MRRDHPRRSATCRRPARGHAPPLRLRRESAYFVSVPPAAAIAAVVAAVESFQRELPALGGGLVFDALGGAINAVAPDATAFVHRDAPRQLQ